MTGVTDTAAKSGTGRAQEKPSEPARYDTDYLIANARSLLSSRSPLVAGALAESGRETHTIAQAKSALKTYVETARPEEGAPSEGEA